jgi:hypothetical protein
MQWVPNEKKEQPEQEPVAIHQFRSLHCADWYDGIPDHHDGHGPYEVRTLYTTPPQREWVGLTDAEIKSEAKYFCHGWYSQNPERLVLLVKTIQAKLREKNT